MSVVWGIEMDQNLRAQRWGDPIIVTRDWYLRGDCWDRGGWAVHARQRVGEPEVAVVSVNFSTPRESSMRYPVKVKASPKTCELEPAA